MIFDDLRNAFPDVRDILRVDDLHKRLAVQGEGRLEVPVEIRRGDDRKVEFADQGMNAGVSQVLLRRGLSSRGTASRGKDWLVAGWSGGVPDRERCAMATYEIANAEILHEGRRSLRRSR